MDRPFVIVAVVLAVPFVATIVAAWAWGWWGVAATVAGGLLLTILTYVNQLIVFINGPRPPLKLATFFLLWLVGVVPGAIIGFGIRSIVSQMRSPSKLEGPN